MGRPREFTAKDAEAACAMITIMLLNEEVDMRSIDLGARKAARRHFQGIAEKTMREPQLADEIARRVFSRGTSRLEFHAFCVWSVERFSARSRRKFVYGESLTFSQLRRYLEEYSRLKSAPPQEPISLAQ